MPAADSPAPPWGHRSLRLAGGLLAAAGVAYVVTGLVRHAGDFRWARFGTVFWIGLGVLALAYGLANLLLARAWRCILESLGLATTWAWSLRAYGLSQMGKYLPGGILHWVGRQALSQSAGLPAGPVARSTLREFALVCLASAGFAVAATPLLTARAPMAAGLVAGLGVTVAAIAVLHRRYGRPVALALALQAAFLALSGLIFAAILMWLWPARHPLGILPLIASAHVVAWMLGFLTPGAPAGMGVREAVLLFLLSAQVPASDLLLAVVLGRAVSMLGDFLFFVLSLAVRPRCGGAVTARGRAADARVPKRRKDP